MTKALTSHLPINMMKIIYTNLPRPIRYNHQRAWKNIIWLGKLLETSMEKSKTNHDDCRHSSELADDDESSSSIASSPGVSIASVDPLLST